jgi:general secretion pathway protein F
MNAPLTKGQRPAMPPWGKRHTPAGKGLARPLSRTARAGLIRELATLTAVMPITDAVDTLARQPRPAREAAVLRETDRALKAGRPLAAALPAASFPPDLKATIAAGEASGRLPALLSRLAEGLEAELALRSRLMAALAYPSLLILVALGVVIGMLVFVVPGIAEQYEGSGAELPLITRIVLGVSGFLAHWGWLMALAGLVALLALLMAWRRPPLRARIETMLLSLPIVGRFLATSEAVRYARLMGVMLGAGLPVAEALHLVAPAMATGPWRTSVARMVGEVRAGKSLSSATAGLPKPPSLLLSLTRSGEASGRLAPLLDSAAATLDRQLSDRSRALLSLLEPAIIVVLGGLVGVIILAVLLPILKLNALAGQAIGVS